MTADTHVASRTLRHATWRNLGLTVVVALVLGILQNRAYNLHVHDPLGPNLPAYLVGNLLGGAIAAVALVLAHRRPASPAGPRAGAILSAIAIVAFPVTYYLPFAFIWGTTSFLLSKDAQPRRLATTARVLGVIALVLTPIVVVLRLVGVTYQVGG